MDGSEIEKALEDLETRIERLRALYEQYFMGIEKLEPQIPRKDVERRITIFRKEQIRNTAQRFKFQTLIQRYNTMQQYWGRVTREIENGTFRRDVLKAAARFGEKDALTILGKKKAKQYASALAAQAEKLGRTVQRDRDDDAVELDADDLLEDEVFLEDPISAQSSSHTPAPRSGQSAGAGLRWGAPTPSKPVSLSGPPASAGSSTDPRSDIRTADAQSGVKRRVAELAAAMKAAKTQEDGQGGFGALDLDFEDGAAGRVTPVPVSPGRIAAPIAPITAPRISPAVGTPAARPLAKLSSPAAKPGAPVGFGALDLPFDDDDAPTPASRERPPVAPAAKPPAVTFGALDLDFDASASARAPAEPSSQRRPTSPGRPSPLPAPGRLSPLPGAPVRGAPSVPTLPPVQPPPAQRPSAGPQPTAPTRPVLAPGGAAHPFARPDPGSRQPIVPPTPPGAPRVAPPVATRPAATAPPAARPADSAPPTPAAVSRPQPSSSPASGGDAGLPDQRIRQLYSKYVDAKRAANESTAGVTYEKLAETLRAQATKLRASHPAKSVDYEVVMKDGRPHLKPILR